MNVLAISLYLILVTLPLGVLIRIPIIPSAYLYPLDITCIVFFCTSLIYVIKRKIHILRLPLFKEWYIFILIGFISLILNFFSLNFTEFIVSSLYGVRLILYSLPLFILPLQSQYFIKTYKKYTFVSGVVFIILGIIQYIFYQSLKGLYYLGWDEHMHRLFSTFLDPNFAGAFLILIFLVLLSKWFDQKKNSSISIFTTIILAINCIAILLTYSRSSFIMLFVSLLSFFTLIHKKKWIALVVVLILFGYTLIPRDFHVENMNLFRTESIKGREGSIKNSLFIFQKSPLYGIGFNSYRYIQRKYGLLDIRFEITHAGAGVSNSYLFVLATTGIIGVSVFFFFWYKVFKSLMYSIQNKKDTYFKAAVLSSLVGVGVHALFENTIFFPFIMVWIFILLGMQVKGSLKADI